MKKNEYANIFKNEDAHWWYRSTHELVLYAIKQVVDLSGRTVVLLDLGCGTGGLLRFLKKRYPNLRVIGIDYSPEAIFFCRKGRNSIPFLRGSADSLPLENASVDVIACIDVLYHSAMPSDYKALREIYRVLKKGGHLFMHLPAFELLRGSHDKAVHTRERYTSAKLQERLREAGFSVIRSGYRNMFLFPLILVKRITERYFQKDSENSDLKRIPYLINNALKVMLFCENIAIRHFSLPLGSSVICLAKKQL